MLQVIKKSKAIKSAFNATDVIFNAEKLLKVGDIKKINVKKRKQKKTPQKVKRRNKHKNKNFSYLSVAKEYFATY